MKQIIFINKLKTFTICSNSNTHVFEEETAVIHNHNEAIYTFMLNCISTYKGEHYIFGEFIISERLSRFGRSDNYINNPRKLEVNNL